MLRCTVTSSGCDWMASWYVGVSFRAMLAVQAEAGAMANARLASWRMLAGSAKEDGHGQVPTGARER